STAPARATRSPHASSSRRWKAAARRSRFTAHASRARSRRPSSGRSPRCRRLDVTTPIVMDCDPGHDDAIAILLAVASPEVELRGVVTVGGNQTIDKTTRNALKVLELVDRSDVPVVRGAEGPLKRRLRTAPHVHGESGMDGPV